MVIYTLHCCICPNRQGAHWEGGVWPGPGPRLNPRQDHQHQGTAQGESPDYKEAAASRTERLSFFDGTIVKTKNYLRPPTFPLSDTSSLRQACQESPSVWRPPSVHQSATLTPSAVFRAASVIIIHILVLRVAKAQHAGEFPRFMIMECMFNKSGELSRDHWRSGTWLFRRPLK